ncbi:MAG: rhomboid family intramembrane serine protease [Gemmataceae bacterium]
MTCSLVGLNLLVFCLQLALGDRFTNGFALVPKEITEARDLDRPTPMEIKVRMRGRPTIPGQGPVLFRTHTVWIEHARGPFPIVLTLFTSTFLHASWIHLIGNMWFLLAFGRNVECAMDHGRYLAFYVVCGLAAGLAQIASNPSSIVPVVGASGAISGVMGAYVAIHPFNKVKVWMGWYIGVMELPALVVIGGWFVTQYLAAFASLEAGARTGVAYWAHLGGFIAGVLYIRAFVLYLRWKELMHLPEEAGADETDGEDLPVESPRPDPFETCLQRQVPAPSSDAIQSAEHPGCSFRSRSAQTHDDASADSPPALAQPAKSPPAMPKPTTILPVQHDVAFDMPTQPVPRPAPLGQLWSALEANPRSSDHRGPKAIVLPVWQRPFGVPAFRPTLPCVTLRTNSAKLLAAHAASQRLESTASFRDRRKEMLEEEDNVDLFSVCLPRKTSASPDPFSSLVKPTHETSVIPPTVRVPLPRDVTSALEAAFDYTAPLPKDRQ